jgi:hypothetical protein
MPAAAGARKTARPKSSSRPAIHAVQARRRRGVAWSSGGVPISRHVARGKSVSDGRAVISKLSNGVCELCMLRATFRWDVPTVGRFVTLVTSSSLPKIHAAQARLRRGVS